MLEIELNLKKRRTHTHKKKNRVWVCVDFGDDSFDVGHTHRRVNSFCPACKSTDSFFFFFRLFWVQGRRMLSHHRLFHDDDAQHTQMEWNGGRFPIDICILLALFYYYRRGKKRSNYGERKKLFFFFLLDEWTPIAVLFSIQQLISSLVNVCQLFTHIQTVSLQLLLTGLV